MNNSMGNQPYYSGLVAQPPCAISIALQVLLVLIAQVNVLSFANSSRPAYF